MCPRFLGGALGVVGSGMGGVKHSVVATVTEAVHSGPLHDLRFT